MADIVRQEAAVPSERISTFLQAVVDHNRYEAEKMLEEDPELCLLPGNVTSQKGRIFNNITGIEYALYTFDFFMWEMMSKYTRYTPDADVKDSRDFSFLRQFQRHEVQEMMYSGMPPISRTLSYEPYAAISNCIGAIYPMLLCSRFLL